MLKNLNKIVRSWIRHLNVLVVRAGCRLVWGAGLLHDGVLCWPGSDLQRGAQRHRFCGAGNRRPAHLPDRRNARQPRRHAAHSGQFKETITREFFVKKFFDLLFSCTWYKYEETYYIVMALLVWPGNGWKLDWTGLQVVCGELTCVCEVKIRIFAWESQPTYK